MSKNETATTVQLHEDCRLKLYGSTFIGTRDYQQDRMFMYEGDGITIAAVCDGMGGMEHGEIASQLAVDMLTEDIPMFKAAKDIKRFLYEEANKINLAVTELKDATGELIESGCTIVLAMAVEQQLYIMSAGDSRIYLIREDIFTRLTRDHNYRLRLEERLRLGMIDRDMYIREESRAEALISFLGIGSSILIDVSTEPIQLQYGDRIMLCSDGLYKGLEDDLIRDIMDKNPLSVAELPDKLIEEALYYSPKGMDNTTVIVGIYE